MKQPLTPPPLSEVKLKDFDPRYVNGDWDKNKAEQRLQENAAAIGALAYRLYAEDRRAVLLVLQGMDTSGKDGTIRSVLADVNPQSFAIQSFKAPTTEELAHDFLWRIHKAEPRSGQIGVFNRSHYEDVLVVRVHKMVPKEVWKARYRQINEFERSLTETGTTILKFFLHISKKEQAKRLKSRIEDKKKNWKFSGADLKERKLWSQYQEAYEDALQECSTQYAPWTVIPADIKWARDAMVARAMVETLETLDLRYPKAQKDLDLVVVK